MSYVGLAFLNILFMFAMITLLVLLAAARIAHAKHTDAKRLKRNAIMLLLGLIFTICSALLTLFTTDFAHEMVLMDSYTIYITLLLAMQFMATVYGVSQLETMEHTSEQETYVNKFTTSTSKAGSSSINS